MFKNSMFYHHREHKDHRETRRNIDFDLIVEGQVGQSVNGFVPIHEALLIVLLKLSGYNIGLLFNFNVILLKDGIRRMKL